jgi:hypothetical protein
MSVMGHTRADVNQRYTWADIERVRQKMEKTVQ